MDNGWKPDSEMKLVDDIHVLRKEVQRVLGEAVRDNLSQEEVMTRLALVDSRFDTELM